jgi:NfeD-like.
MIKEAIMEWWNSLSNISQIWFIMACSASVITIVQIIMMLIGFDGDSTDIDIDLTDTDAGDFGAFSFFSIRGFIAGLSIGSWVAYIFAGMTELWLNIIIMIVATLITMFIYALIMKAIMRLQTSGNTDIINAVGKEGEVYIPVPPMRNGKGKITAECQGNFMEIEAVSDSEEKLQTGTQIIIKEKIDDTTVLVEKNKFWR